MINFAKYKLQVFFFIVSVVLVGTFLAIKFTQGYRLDFTNKTIKPTGLLVASSVPKGAQVFVNGELKTATDNTVSLEPGEYEIKIEKDGFLPWQKKLTVEKELVTPADALLFPRVPDLKPLTFDEAQNPQLSPDGSKIVYSVSYPHPKAGLWVMDLTDFIFNLGREPKQIAQSSLTHDFAKAEYSWSLDSKQVLIDFGTTEKYLLDPNNLNTLTRLTNVAYTLPQIYDTWAKEEKLRQEAKMKKVPELLAKILTESAKEVEFSPDNTKIMYIATTSAQIPEKLLPPVLAASTQPESRNLEPNRLYVYDLKEDRNFLIPVQLPDPTPTPTPTPTPKNRKTVLTPTPSPAPIAQHQSPIRWFPSSRHLYWIEGDKVIACEYDATNVTTIYSGPFTKPFVYATPGGNKLVILTNISSDPETKLNLYSVSLK
ncbi:MAG: PEGA domain-containing protein [Patescibacteria group bacterium]|jgi:hypothetical protein